MTVPEVLRNLLAYRQATTFFRSFSSRVEMKVVANAQSLIYGYDWEGYFYGRTMIESKYLFFYEQCFQSIWTDYLSLNLVNMMVEGYCWLDSGYQGFLVIGRVFESLESLPSLEAQFSFLYSGFSFLSINSGNYTELIDFNWLISHVLYIFFISICSNLLSLVFGTSLTERDILFNCWVCLSTTNRL